MMPIVALYKSQTVVSECTTTSPLKPHSRTPRPHTTMSFSHSSHSIHLRGTVLHARCKDQHGEYRESSIDLDAVLGNNDGRFTLHGGNFAHSARDVQLDGTELSATLRDTDGEWHRTSIDLNRCIGNSDGRLHHHREDW